MFCTCANCQAATTDSTRRRMASGVAILHEGHAVLLDATPDIRHQWLMLPPKTKLAGIALTHAHAGHIAGLSVLGKEGPQAACALIATAALHAHVQATSTFADGTVNMEKVVMTPGRTLEYPVALRFHPIVHRAERSDTVAIEVRSERTLLYLPDTDTWDEAVAAAVSGLAEGDVFLFDATFWSSDELKHRNISTIPHPLVEQTLPQLAALAKRGVRVILTHLNHTNPLCNPQSSATATITKIGLEVATDGMHIPL